MTCRLLRLTSAAIIAGGLSSCTVADYNQAMAKRYQGMSDEELMRHIGMMNSDLGGVRPVAVAEAERRRLFRSQYEADAARGRVSIGMPDYLARKAWGNPDEVNRTASAHGASEQWVYGGARGTIYTKMKFVYIEDGRVVLIQS